MEWKAFLTGDESDLDDLSKSFCDPGLAIAKEADGFALKSTRFSELDDADAIREEVERTLVLINGAARLQMGTWQGVALARIDEDGSGSCFLHVEDSIRLTIRERSSITRITHADGRVEEFMPSPTDPRERWVQVGLRNKAVAKVLRLLHTKDEDWVNLYRVYEVIEQETGGPDAISKRGWASKAELKLFKHTANSVSAIGDDARHGSDNIQPPPTPMTLSDARSLIRNMVRNWLEMK